MATSVRGASRDAMQRTHTGLAGRKTRGRTFLIILATVVAASGWLPRPANGQQIIEIDVSALGGANVSPQDINNAGQVVGSYEASIGVRHAFVWMNGVMVDIETDPDATSTALAINDAGVVVGQTTDTDGDTIAFRWAAPGPMIRITVFDGRSIAGRESTALDINNDGVIVGYARAPSPFGLVDRAYRLSGFGPGQQIGGLSAFVSRAFAINDLGQIVGQSDSTSLINRATFWDPFAIQLDTATSLARDVNDSGKAVGRQGTSIDRARLWELEPNNQPIETRLDPLLGHSNSSASGIRDEAGGDDPTEIVGVSFNSSTEARAVRWLVDAQGTPTVEDLNDLLSAGSGWVLQSARAINDRGQIVGTGTLDGNEGRGFLFDPQEPEPPTEEPPAVLFLHGILASFLYQGPEEARIWPAFFDANLEVLGSASFRGGELDVFPREEDIIKEFFTLNVYQDFSRFMDNQKVGGVIHDWYAYAYDWRQDWRQIVTDGTIYSAFCFEPQGEFFIPDCNRCGICVRLADKIVELATSQGPALPGAPQPPPRKVWIVAHSNGGLLAKTLLGQLFSDVQAHVAGLILVASPQLGTPKALSPLLHGGEYAVVLASNRALRTAVLKIPGAYQLLPTARFFDQTPRPEPVLEFEESGFGGGLEVDLWKDHYNGAIDTFAEMEEFLLGLGGPRKDLTPSTRIDWPAILDPNTFSQSQSAHAEIEGFDSQAHPFPVYQIVGSGLPTIRGLKYGSQNLRGSLLGTLNTCEGDETVVLSSAAALRNATTYFVDLAEYNSRRGANNSHMNILNVDEIQTLIVRLLQGNLSIDDLEFIGASKPTPPCTGGFVRTRSPAEIHLFQGGLHTGPVPAPDVEGSFPLIEEAIPNSQYRSLAEGREALVVELGPYEVVIEATGTGTVTLEGGRFQGDLTTEVFRIPDIPIRTGSRIEFAFDPTADSPPPMTMDVEGDGTPDFVLSADAPPGTEVFLAVLRSAVEELKANTGAAGFRERTERKLHKILRKALRALEEASEEQSRGRSDEVLDELEDAQESLEDYQKRLGRDVERGHAPEGPADALLEEASQIEELLETLVAGIADEDDRDDDDADDDKDKDKDKDDDDDDDD